MELLIYCEQITPRTDYVFGIIFGCLSKASYRITGNKDEYISHQGPKLNYGLTSLPGGLHIAAAPLLFMKGIEKIDVNAGQAEGKMRIFLHGGAGRFNYDAVAAIFYMVSRYEEYLSFSADEHGRFPMKESLAYKMKFHKRAVVHDWADDIITTLENMNPGWKAYRKDYAFIPTFDIDNAYAYIHKSPLKVAGGIIKSLLRADDIRYRINVLRGRAPDPYDNYEFIEGLNKSAAKEALFFHLAASNGRYDRNIPPGSRAFRNLVQRLDRSGKIGLHPSFASASQTDKIAAEANILKEITGREVTLSRQHFLKLSLPRTYRSLMKAGITDDYSMGYAEDSGFRAGISRSYPFYDLEAEHKCNLNIHPFQVMDSALKYYRDYDAGDATSEITSMIGEVKRVQGEFVPVWHNESLSDKGAWLGWRKVIMTMYKSAAG